MTVKNLTKGRSTVQRRFRHRPPPAYSGHHINPDVKYSGISYITRKLLIDQDSDPVSVQEWDFLLKYSFYSLTTTNVK